MFLIISLSFGETGSMYSYNNYNTKTTTIKAVDGHFHSVQMSYEGRPEEQPSPRLRLVVVFVISLHEVNFQ